MGGIGEHFKDIKAHRKRKRGAQLVKANKKSKRNEGPPPRRCWDWMITTGNCHYAKNRSSFKEYRRVGKRVPSGIIEGISTFVAGVGTIELKVQTTRERGSPVRTLVLRDVLHIPEANCNGFSVAVYHTLHGGSTSLGREPSGTDSEYQPLWCSEGFKGLNKLVLAGNPQGESYLGDGIKMLSMHIGCEDLEEIIGPRQGRDEEGSEEQLPEYVLPDRPCMDWVVVSGNCHYARDKSFFKDYREVGVSAQNYAALADMVYVAGIGTVEIKVQARREAGSPIRTLVLKNVLHVPDAICNGFAFIEYHKFHGRKNTRDPSQGLDGDGQALWCSEPTQGVDRRLVLPGQPGSKLSRNSDLQSPNIYIEDEDMLEITGGSDYSDDDDVCDDDSALEFLKRAFAGISAQ